MRAGRVQQNPAPGSPEDQELRPRFGLRPWLAFLRRALFFFFWVRFDIGVQRYNSAEASLKSATGSGSTTGLRPYPSLPSALALRR